MMISEISANILIPYQKPSCSLRTGICGEKLLMLSSDSVSCMGCKYKEVVRHRCAYGTAIGFLKHYTCIIRSTA